MKKIIAIFMTVVFLMLTVIPAFAADQASHPEKVDISSNSSNFSCDFNPEKNIIEIKGTINHDVLVKYGNFTICIYNNRRI